MRSNSMVGARLALAIAIGVGGISCAAAAQSAAPATADTLLQQSSDLASRGKLIQARSILASLSDRAHELDDDQRRQAAIQFRALGRQIKDLDPIELSLQKAELALIQDNLTLAGSQASAVLASGRADDRQAGTAEDLISRIEARRIQMKPLIDDAIEQATMDFAAERYDAAKAGFSAVIRSGVELSDGQRAVVVRYQQRLLDLERAQGFAFDVETALAGVFQPGVVHRREQPADDAPADEQPADQPPADDQPADDQPVDPDELIQQAVRTDVDSLLADADAAFQQNQMADAAARYARLQSEYRDVLSDEEQALVTDRLQEARAAISQADPLDDFVNQIHIAKQRALSQYNNLMEQARQAMDSGNTVAARDLVARARLTINSGRNLFAESEFENYINRSDDLLSEIEAADESIRNEEARQRDQQRQAEAARREADRQREKEQRINELLERARDYQREQRYDEALQSIDQLLFIDPLNAAGLFLREILLDIRIYRKFLDVSAAKQQAYATNSIDNLSASIPPPGIVNYPADWPAITFRRGEETAFSDSPQNRMVLAELDKPIPAGVSFTDDSLASVLGFFETMTQVNMDVDWESLENDAGIERETPVTLSLQNVSAGTVLERVLDKVSQDFGKADWAVNDGILTIASDEKLRKNTVLVIYDIRDLLLDVPDYDEVPEIDLQSVLQSNQGGGGQSPFRDDQQDEEEDGRTLEERTLDIIDIITQNVDFEGWTDNGGETGAIQQLNGNLIITNTARNHSEISGLLTKLRQIRAMQINVETRFLLVNQDFFEQIGFDLDVVFNSNNNQVRALQGTDPDIQGSDLFQFNPNALPADSDGVGVGLQRTVTGPGGVTQSTPNARSWSPVSAIQNSIGIAAGLLPSSGIGADILTAGPALGIAGQFLDDIQVDFLIIATQADRRSIQLTAPRLTFTNGQTANIYVATQVAFISDLQPVVGDSAVGFDPEVDVVTEGVTLLVEGTVSADRRYVTLNVDAGVSRIDGFGMEAVTAVAGGELVNSADTQSFIQTPTVTVTRVRTTVTVPDQGTILLGGQRVVTEFEVESGVPVLSKLPVLGRFFSNRLESKEEQTLLILLKPTVLIQNEEEEQNFPGLLDSMRTGFTG